MNQVVPQKIHLKGCEFSIPLDIRFTDKMVRVHGELECEPGYGDPAKGGIRLEDRFLVEVNRLHISLATLVAGGQLLLESKPLHHANRMMRRSWDVRSFRGRKCIILIIDSPGGGLNHINVDDFVGLRQILTLEGHHDKLN